MKKFFEFEEKVKNWIENNRIKWCFLLFILGFVLGHLANIALGGEIRQGFAMGFGYAILLVIIEISAGGSGIN